MKEKRILDALNEVDEQYIEEADAAAPVKRRNWVKWGALAACLALVVGLGVHTLSRPGVRPIPAPTGGPSCSIPPKPSNSPEITPTVPVTPPPPDTPSPTPTAIPGELPILNVEFVGGDMGFEGLLQYDPAEIHPNNPWSDDTVLKTLPVYRNLACPSELAVPHYFGKEDLLRRAKEVAAALGTTIQSTEYSHAGRISIPSQSPEDEKVVYRIQAQIPLGEIEVDGTGTVSIFFEPAIDLPNEYSFTYSDTSDVEAKKTISYLLDRFSALYAPEAPAIDTGGDYSIYGEQHRTYRAYDGSGDVTRQLLSYYFDGITFSPNEEGQLWIIRFGSPLQAAEKIGDYPIITAQEAQTLLLEGSYLTTVPPEYLTGGKITEEAIVKTELVYRTNLYEPTFMPYYRFYVELDLPDGLWELPEGLKNYGAYYVPAVEGEYLSGLPALGELRFN